MSGKAATVKPDKEKKVEGRPIRPQSIGNELLAKILQEKRVPDFLAVKREYFYQDELKVYDFIKTFHDKHKSLPSMEVARKKTHYLIDAVDANVPYQHFYGEYSNRAVFNQFSDALPKVGRHLEQRNMEKAVEVVTALLEQSKKISGWNVGDPWETETFMLKNAYEKRDAVQYLVDGLLPLPSLSMVYGAPGSLKSFLLADMSVCIAGGKSWLGRKVIQSSVLFVDLDNGLRRTHDRFEALGRAHKLSADARLFYVSMPSSWFNAGDSQDMENMIQRITKKGIKLICIDCLDRIRGGADENSGDMANVMTNLRLISEKTDAAVVVIHHQRKSGNGKTKARAGESLRGHSSIEASLDLALLVDRESPSALMTVRCTKQRDSDVPPFNALFKYETKPDNRLLTASFVSSEFSEKPSPAEDTETFIIELLTKKSMNQSAIVKKVKQHLDAGRPQIRETLSSMTNGGILKIDRGNKNSVLYSLKNLPVLRVVVPPKGGEQDNNRNTRNRPVVRNNRKQLTTTKQLKDDLQDLC